MLRNKDKKLMHLLPILSSSSQASSSQLYSFILNSSSSSPCQAVQNEGRSQSVTVPLCLSFILTSFPCSRTSLLHGLKCPSGEPAPLWSSPQAVGESLLQHMEHLLPSIFSDFGVHRVFSSFFFLHFSLLCGVMPFNT